MFEVDDSRFFRWRMYLDYAGGPVTDLYPHSLTPVASMLGLGVPELAVATGGKFRYDEREVPDTFNVLLDDPGGLTVAVLGTQGNDLSGTERRGAGNRAPILRGWEGSIEFEGNEIVVRPVQGGTSEEKRVPIERGESIAAHRTNFLECCRTRARPDSPIDLACGVQLALQMAMRAHLERRTVGSGELEGLKF